MSYFATKYSDPVTDVLHSLTQDWMLNYSGDVDFGLWFTEPFEIERSYIPATLPTLAELDELTITEQFETIQQLPGIWMLSGNDQGFIYSERFESVESAQAEYDRLEALYLEWDSQCAECGSATEWSDAEGSDVCSTDPSHRSARY
jgi:hypothetical protein